MASVTLALDELVAGAARRVDLDGAPVAVVRIDDADGPHVYAVGDICSHAHVSLSGGEVWTDEREIECPKHSSTFDLRTGVPTCLPATQPIPVYVVEIADGKVTITDEGPASR